MINPIDTECPECWIPMEKAAMNEKGDWYGTKETEPTPEAIDCWKCRICGWCISL